MGTSLHSGLDFRARSLLLIVLELACGQPAIPLGADPRHAGNTGPGIGWSNPKIGPDLNSARGHAQCEEAEAQNILDTC